MSIIKNINNTLTQALRAMGTHSAALEPAVSTLPVATYLTQRWAFDAIRTWQHSKDLYYANPIAQGCSLAYQLTIAEAPLVIIDPQGKVVDVHPMYELLDRSHIKKIIARMMLHLSIGGNFYIYQQRDERGAVVLWRGLHSRYVTPIVDDYGNIIYYIYSVGTYSEDIAAEDIIHITGFWLDAEREWMGISPIQLASTSIQAYNEATRSIYSLHKNDEVPKTAIVYDAALTPQQKVQAEESFRARHGGELRGTTAHLWGVKDIKRLGLGWDEMGMNDTFMQLEARICSTYRVHPIIAFTYAGLMKSTYANFDAASRDFTTYSRVPLWSLLQEQLTHGIQAMYPGYSLIFDTTQVESLRPDIGAVRKEARELFALGAISVDELRAAHDYAVRPVAAGSTLMLTLNEHQESIPEKYGVEKLSSAIKKVLDNLGDDVVNSVSTLTLRSPLNVHTHDIDWEDWAQKLALATEEERADIINNAIKEAIREVDGTEDEGEFTRAQQAGVDESSNKIRESIGTIRDDVRDIISINPRATESEMKNLLLTMFKDMNPVRAATIARTTTTAATGVSQKDVWAEMNTRTDDPAEKITRQWVAVSGARAAHAAASGQLEDDEGFFTVGGERTQFPAGPGLSAANAVNCRCFTRAIRGERLAVKRDVKKNYNKAHTNGVHT